MDLFLDRDDCDNVRVDRDGVRNDAGRQGMEICFNGITIRFADERDAELLARRILYRLGVTLVGSPGD